MITIVHNDHGDWVGIYNENGKLLDQQHSFDESQILKLVGVDHILIHGVVLVLLEQILYQLLHQA